jgi:endothelin-converting enzyme
VGFPTSPNTTDARSVANYYSLVEIDEKQFVKNMLGAAYVLH